MLGSFAACFAGRGCQPRAHQLAMVEAARDGDSALLIAPTGGGKTLAGFLPSLFDLHAMPRDGLRTLHVSPLEALAVDIARNVRTRVEEMRLPIRAPATPPPTAAPASAKRRRRSC
jgi:ATP-dependent Lhr-like helicase